MERADSIYEEYKIARDAIQLTKACIISCQAEQLADFDAKTECTLPTKLLKKYNRISDNEIHGYVKAEISVVSRLEDKEIAKLMVECKGVFNVIKSGLEKEEEEKRVNLQMVPQLLPYIRSSLTNLSSMMSIPPITLPTIDVIKSIQKNR